jgi:hypothetical protein
MSAARAIALYRRFFGRNPAQSELVTVKQAAPLDGIVIGRIERIIYVPTGKRQGHIHKFKPGSQPRLFVSDDGGQFLPLGGSYKFTSRGFVK